MPGVSVAEAPWAAITSAAFASAAFARRDRRELLRWLLGTLLLLLLLSPAAAPSICCTGSFLTRASLPLAAAAERAPRRWEDGGVRCDGDDEEQPPATPRCDGDGVRCDGDAPRWAGSGAPAMTSRAPAALFMARAPSRGRKPGLAARCGEAADPPAPRCDGEEAEAAPARSLAGAGAPAPCSGRLGLAARRPRALRTMLERCVGEELGRRSLSRWAGGLPRWAGKGGLPGWEAGNWGLLAAPGGTGTGVGGPADQGRRAAAVLSE